MVEAYRSLESEMVFFCKDPWVCGSRTAEDEFIEHVGKFAPHFEVGAASGMD
jgi:hypothetical protein